MASQTSNQALPYPQGTDTPADTPLFIQSLAQAVEKKLVQVFTTTSDRDTKLTAPTNGMLAVCTSSEEMFLRVGGAWVRIYPTTSQIMYGTSTPSNSSGADGDIYMKY